ncbi:MAG TPA: FkbM family methyltransferase [Sunxiuqinia sp.]|nr:FkbM family methyltransferase [Sunxiuqinia sp.]
MKQLIREGDVVIDLGANVGYYSRIFAKLVKGSGRIYSIEPVKLFRAILEKNTNQYQQVEILPYAIGEKDGQDIKMGVPHSTKYFSHGKTHIVENENENLSMTFTVKMKKPDNLFKNLERLDYLKCDIEGYEGIAIPLFDTLLKKFHPILQIELSPKNRPKLFDYLQGMGYVIFNVKGGKLSEVFSQNDLIEGDIIFIHSEKIDQVKRLITEG